MIKSLIYQANANRRPGVASSPFNPTQKARTLSLEVLQPATPGVYWSRIGHLPQAPESVPADSHPVLTGTDGIVEGAMRPGGGQNWYSCGRCV